ncbi:hypothetical protein [Streptomyces huiliensis]|uniref:hypothetical protein n=1 Tax=Streptomyces huiliensis TaxID=2876027 RepID=UPI001CBB5E2A|nr:hypothetical protein [Streptomyces huiliensis]MBZ4322474.1 hypothetical protein [Streptomyces huiliensis]
MRIFVDGHEAVTIEEFIELALGTPPQLWLGVEGETSEERAARLAAARDILAEDPQMVDRISHVAARAIEEHAPSLFNILPFPAAAGGPRDRRAVA